MMDRSSIGYGSFHSITSSARASSMGGTVKPSAWPPLHASSHGAPSCARPSARGQSVDLINLDPPFNSHASCNVLFKAPTGEHFEAQIEA
jgi:hypothetical protein